MGRITYFFENKAFHPPWSEAFHLPALGHFHSDPDHVMTRKKGLNGELIAIWVLGGAGKLRDTANRRSYEITKNQLILIPPEASHHYESSSTQPWNIIWAHLKGDIAIQMAKNKFNSWGNHWCESIHLPLPTLKDMLLAAKLNKIEDMVCLCQLALAQSLPRKGNEYESVLSMMKDNLHSHVSLKTCANAMNWSEAHFSRKFKEAFGIPPLRYFLDLKLRAVAKTMVDKPNVPLQDIARTFGFEDPYHFSKSFKTWAGVPPRRFRQNIH